MRKFKSSKRIPNLTSIRFFLALLVMLFHISEFSKNRKFPFFDSLAIFHKGTEAVYVFFSLSGFLIIKQLYDEKKLTNKINLKKFYLKRILRIFPLYYLVLTFGFLYYNLILPHFGYQIENNYDLLTGLLLSVTFFSNIFSTYSPGGILEILWSIGIEEQFYLLIAPLLFMIPRKKITLFLILFTIIYFLMYFSSQFYFLQKYHMLFFYFSFGGLCAILLENKFFRTLIIKLRYPILITFIIYFSTSIFNKIFNSFFYHLFSLLLFGLTMAVLAVKPISVLQNKIINHLGKISYGIYMYHAIVLQFVGFMYLKYISRLNFKNFVDILIINALVISITIMISHFSFKYYEGYFLSLKNKIMKKNSIEKR